MNRKTNLDDSINYLGKSQAFFTLKDHKENFRQINPTKRDLEKVSKIIEEINFELWTTLERNQCKTYDQ